MQSLVLPRPAFTPDPFGPSRFNPSPNRLPLDRSRSSDARGSRPRAHHLYRPMSPRPEERIQPLQHVRRPEVPQETGCSVPTTDGTSEPVAAAATLAPLREPVVSQATSDRLSPTSTAKRRLSIAESLGVPHSSPSVTGPPPLQSVAISLPSTTTPLTSPTTPPDAAALALPPKSARRTKAHVASACINCKKKHLGCDSARPCRRCVASGKGATCVDVTHKKRGRPPLKAEEPSIRTFSAQFEPPTSTVDLQQVPQARTRLPGHRATSSRELRPMTDLFAPGTAAGLLGLRAAPGPPQRWSASAGPSAVPALDSILPLPGAFGPAQRSYSVGSSQHSLAPAHHGQHYHRRVYNPRDSTLPSLVSGSNQPTAPRDRPSTSYSTHPPLPPTTSPPLFRQPFGAPISPSLDRARLLSKLGDGSSEPAMTARGPLEMRPESPVQLPPILSTLPNASNLNPAPGTSMHAHRLSDPSPSTWLYRTGRDEPPPSLPLPPARYYHSDRPGPLPLYTQTEPVSPMTRFKELPTSSTMNQTQQYIGSYITSMPGPGPGTASKPVAGPPPTAVTGGKAALFSAGQTPDRPRTATAYTYIPPQPGATRPAEDVSEPEDLRPVKRRKMAVNDMVND